jgi:hypothetical protein
MAGFRVKFLILMECIRFGGLVAADDDSVPDSATTTKFDFAHHCKVGEHTFRFEITTLADIVRALGNGTIRGNGKDAGGGEFGVEYVDGDYLIRFSSNAEMGGADHRLGGIEVRLLNTDEKRSDFPSLVFPVIFQFGTVGRPFSDLVAQLGPAEKTNGIAWYQCSGKKAIKDSSGKIFEYDIFGALRVKVVDGKVTAIHVWHVTSS